MGNCAKPKRKLREPVVVTREHFSFRQLHILNRLNPAQVKILRNRFAGGKAGPGYRLRLLNYLFPDIPQLPEIYVRNLFAMLDLTKDDVICFTDFCIAAARVSLAGAEERLRFLFDFLNVKGKTSLPRESLQTSVSFGALRWKSGCEADLLSLSDQISFREFSQLAQRHVDVDGSLSFCTFLPTPQQQNAEIVAIFSVHDRPHAGETWFLVSSQWVQAWERYVSFPTSLTVHPSIPWDESDIPTAIDNSYICNKAEPLLVDAERGDFVCVPGKVWKYWEELYGGGPEIAREAVQCLDGRVEIDIFPCLVVVFEAVEDFYDVQRRKKVLLSVFPSHVPLRSSLCVQLSRSECEVELFTRANKRWQKISEQLLTSALKPNTKCLVIAKDSPLANCEALREVKANTSELKQYRILSKWDLECGAESPQLFTPEKIAVPSPALVYKGIPNIGNTCYMNCVLQCLCYTPLFGHFFLSYGFELRLNTKRVQSLSQGIADLFGSMRGGEGAPRPENVHLLLGQQLDLFQGHDENDSYECLVTMLDRLHEELKRGNMGIVLSRSLTSPSPDQLRSAIYNLWFQLHGDFGSPVSDLFSGVTKTTVACSHCSHQTVTLTPTFSLDLQLPQVQNLDLILTFVPTSGATVSIGLTCPTVLSVESLIQQAKVLLGTEIGEVKLVAWAYNGVFTVYTAETKLQEVACDASVSLFALEMDGKVKNEQEEAAPTPRETAIPQSVSDFRLIRLIHRFHITRDNVITRDYFPELVYVPEKLTQAELLDIISARSKRFQSEQVPADRQKLSCFYVDFATRQCGVCSRWECLGCGIEPTDTEVEWKRWKEKCVVWVRWETPDSFAVRKDVHGSVEEVKRNRKKGVNLDDCLDVYSKAETLSASCDKCQKELTSRIEVVKLPDILVVTFCRFRIRDSMPIKVNSLVEFPLTSLDMGKWVTSSEAKPGSCTLLTTPLQYVYDLYAVVDHVGNARSGHYRAYCKMQEDGETWVRFDDSQASVVSVPLEEALVTSSAYLLFYQKRMMQTKNLVQFSP